MPTTPSSQGTVEGIFQSLTVKDADDVGGKKIRYSLYRGYGELPAIMALVDAELSEPYIVYTYRYFLDEWYSALSPFSSVHNSFR
jgi:hypothetical protein